MQKNRVNLLLIVALCSSLSACLSEEKESSASTVYMGAEDEVTIHRDEWGVPHIYASEEANGYYGLGYAMAEDQLERFLFSIHFARGTISANISPGQVTQHIFGPLPAEQMLEMDYEAKLWNVRHHAELSLPKLDPQVRENYQRYIDGVNAFMAANPGQVPDWAPENIEVADLVTAPLSFLWGFYNGGVGVNDCRRAGIQTKTAASALANGPGDNSNQWAIMPSRSATGGAILLTDPHGGIDGRFTYEYVMHAGDFHSNGYALGAALFLGRTENIGWGLTTGSPDVADCFEINVQPDNPDSYLFDGKEKTFTSKELVIEVKNAEPVKITVKYSDHNGVPSPVVAEVEGKAYVASTPYYNNVEGLHNVARAMHMAKNVDEFLDAQRTGWFFPQNLLVADRQGDILYFRAGMTPIRPNADLDWLKPVDGNSSATAWQGIHPVDDLLSIKSPEVAYLQNNNVYPTFMDSPQPKETVGMPSYLLTAGYTQGPNSRGQRAIDVLSKTEAMDQEQAFDLAFDTLSLGSERWISMLQAALADDASLSDEEKAFADDLLSFDGHLDNGSTSALKYVYWREALGKDLSPDYFDSLRASISDGQAPSPELTQKISTAAKSAAARMQATSEGFGRTYGDEFRVRGLAGQSWPMSGGSFGGPRALPNCSLGPIYFCPTSLLAMGYSPQGPDGKRYAVAGSRIMRLDFYSPEGIESYSAQNPGISDDLTSAHFDDQAEKLMSNKLMKKVYFDWSDLEPNIVSSKTLQVTQK